MAQIMLCRSSSNYARKSYMAHFLCGVTKYSVKDIFPLTDCKSWQFTVWAEKNFGYWIIRENSFVTRVWHLQQPLCDIEKVNTVFENPSKMSHLKSAGFGDWGRLTYVSKLMEISSVWHGNPFIKERKFQVDLLLLSSDLHHSIYGHCLSSNQRFMDNLPKKPKWSYPSEYF